MATTREENELYYLLRSAQNDLTLAMLKIKELNTEGNQCDVTNAPNMSRIIDDIMVSGEKITNIYYQKT